MDETADHRQPVIVGVLPGQPAHIVEQAARFAGAFRAELICAHVRTGLGDEVVDAALDTALESELEAQLAHVLAGSSVTWSTRLLAGDITAALGHLAATVDAAMIVVGSHERSFGGGVQEFFNRSVAVHLAHRQDRPVVVVPARQ